MVTQRAKQSTLTKRALKPGLETENRVRLFVAFCLTQLFLWQVVPNWFTSSEKIYQPVQFDYIFCFMQRCRGK